MLKQNSGKGTNHSFQECPSKQHNAVMSIQGMWTRRVPLEAKPCLEVSMIASRSLLYSAISSQNPARSHNIFRNELVLLRVIVVVSLCCCIWLLPFPPTWNLIRSRWEMEHKVDKQCCYLVRNAVKNRGNPTFPYEDNFSNKTLSKYAGPSHKGSLTWARQKLRSVCCKRTLKPLYKRCLTSAKAEIHVQTSGSKNLAPTSIKLRCVHADCPGTSLAVSPQHPASGEGRVLGKSL